MDPVYLSGLNEVFEHGDNHLIPLKLSTPYRVTIRIISDWSRRGISLYCKPTRLSNFDRIYLASVYSSVRIEISLLKYPLKKAFKKLRRKCVANV